MTDEDRAHALSSWLGSKPGSPPPDGVEPDVVEAVYSLRPDLAPAPRLTADDLLASLTSGPLAAAPARAPTAPPAGSTVVPFPRPEPMADSASPRIEHNPARRWRVPRWAGGASGLALAAAAVASFVLLLDRPGLVPAPSATHEVAPVELSPGAPAAASRQEASGAPAEPAQPEARRAPPPPPTPSSGPSSQVASEEAPVATGEVLEATSAYDMDGARAIRDRAGIAELETKPALAADAAEDEQAVGDSGRKLERALADAEALAQSGDLKGAGDRAARAVERPAADGQRAAAVAARYYLRAGLPAEAERVTERGLGLSPEPSPARAELEALLEEARSAQ